MLSSIAGTSWDSGSGGTDVICPPPSLGCGPILHSAVPSCRRPATSFGHPASAQPPPGTGRTADENPAISPKRQQVPRREPERITPPRWPAEGAENDRINPHHMERQARRR